MWRVSTQTFQSMNQITNLHSKNNSKQKMNNEKGEKSPVAKLIAMYYNT